MGDGGGIYNDGVATVINSTINKHTFALAAASDRTAVSPVILARRRRR